MKLATLILCLAFAAPAVADSTFRLPDGRVAYVVDIENIGVGRLQKPRGIDVLILRDGGRWGVIPPSVYRSPSVSRSARPSSIAPSRAGYRYGSIR